MHLFLSATPDKQARNAAVAKEQAKVKKLLCFFKSTQDPKMVGDRSSDHHDDLQVNQESKPGLRTNGASESSRRAVEKSPNLVNSNKNFTSEF